MDIVLKKKFEVEMGTKPPLQMERTSGLSVVGTDVEALFPSLPDIESAKVVRCAVKESNIIFNNVDYNRALVYLRLVGGKDLRLDVSQQFRKKSLTFSKNRQKRLTPLSTIRRRE